MGKFQTGFLGGSKFSNPSLKAQQEILKWLQANLGKHSNRAPGQRRSLRARNLCESLQSNGLLDRATTNIQCLSRYRLAKMQPHARSLAYHASPSN